MEYACTDCDLYEKCNTVKMESDGTGDVLFLGEAPGEQEDLQGRPFVGESGKLLKTFVSALDIASERIRYSNSVRCHPPKNKTPSMRQVKACNKHLVEEIEKLDTKYIVPLGATAVKALRQAGYLRVPGTISSLHGQVVEEDEKIIIPMLHPAYILSNPSSATMYATSMNKLEDVFLNGVPEKAKTDYNFSDDICDLEDAIAEACSFEKVAYDIETSCLYPYEQEDARMLSFSLSWKENQAFAFLLTKNNREEALEVLHTQFLENTSVLKIIQHFKFELLWSMFYKRTILNATDTMLEHWHLEEKNGTHGLKNLALNYTDLGFYDADLEEYKRENPSADPEKLYLDPETGEKRRGSYSNLPLEILLPYNCCDTDATLRIHNKIAPLLNNKQRDLVSKVQIPACYLMAEMELEGVPIDWEYAEKLNRELPEKISKIEETIFEFPDVREYQKYREEIGKGKINLNSHVQLAELLFGQMGYDSLYKTDSGKPSTDKNVLEYLEKKHKSEPVSLIRQRREIATIYNTFVKGAFKQRKGERIHTTYGVAHTETGRLNSKNPNLQNIPRGEVIRRMFRPTPGNLMVQADYSQVELRIMALVSGDKNLLQYFKDDLDVHSMIASRIYRKDPADIDKEERVRAKRTVFGLCYGQMAKGLSEELNISLGEAQRFLDKFFAEFPDVYNWIKSTQRYATEYGEVETIFGRIRRLPDAKNENEGDPNKQRALRQAINQPIQGAAVDILLSKFGPVYEFRRAEKLKTRALLTVHDSLNFDVFLDECNFFIPAIKMILEDFSEFDWITIPIKCDLEIGFDWGGLVSLDPEDVKTLEQGREIADLMEDLLNR